MVESLGTEQRRRGGIGRGENECTIKGCGGGSGRFAKRGIMRLLGDVTLKATGGRGGVGVAWRRVMWRELQTGLE